MKIYLINLARSKDRFEYMSSQFDKLGLPFERVDAVDGLAINPYDYVGFKNPSVRHVYKPICCNTDTELACNLSHAKALDMIANGDDDYGVVFEDDMLISSSAGDFLKDCSWIPRGVDMIKLDTGFRRTTFQDMDLKDHLKLQGGRLLCHLLSNPYIAGCYIVSKEMAAFLSTELKKTPFLTDVFYYDYTYGIASKVQPKVLVPPLCTFANIPSDIYHYEYLPEFKHSAYARTKYKLIRIYSRFVQTFKARIKSPLKKVRHEHIKIF